MCKEVLGVGITGSYPETGFAEITQRATIYKDHSLLYILRNPDSQHISQIMGSWKSGAGFVAVLIIFTT